MQRDGYKFIGEDGKEDLKSLAEFSNVRQNILEEIQEALKTKIVSDDHLLMDESQSILSGDKVAIPSELLEEKQNLTFLFKARDQYLLEIEENIKPHRRGLYRDLLEKRLLPRDGHVLTLEQIAVANKFKNKQNAEPAEKEIVESLTKKVKLMLTATKQNITHT